MIDNLALGVSHGLMLLVVWRILQRPDLDSEDGGTRSFLKRRGKRDA